MSFNGLNADQLLEGVLVNLSRRPQSQIIQARNFFSWENKRVTKHLCLVDAGRKENGQFAGKFLVAYIMVPCGLGRHESYIAITRRDATYDMGREVFSAEFGEGEAFIPRTLSVVGSLFRPKAVKILESMPNVGPVKTIHHMLWYDFQEKGIIGPFPVESIEWLATAILDNLLALSEEKNNYVWWHFR